LKLNFKFFFIAAAVQFFSLSADAGRFIAMPGQEASGKTTDSIFSGQPLGSCVVTVTLINMSASPITKSVSLPAATFDAATGDIIPSSAAVACLFSLCQI
jgi:hypothetical protein